MAQSNAAGRVVRRIDLDPSLDGVQRLRAMFAAKGFLPTDWARAEGIIPQQLSMCMHNQRTYPEIREKLAAFFGKSRSVIDALIEGRPDDADAAAEV